MVLYYYYTPFTARVRQIILIVVPDKFRKVMISESHVYLLSVNIHKQ